MDIHWKWKQGHYQIGYLRKNIIALKRIRRTEHKTKSHEYVILMFLPIKVIGGSVFKITGGSNHPLGIPCYTRLKLYSPCGKNTLYHFTQNPLFHFIHQPARLFFTLIAKCFVYSLKQKKYYLKQKNKHETSQLPSVVSEMKLLYIISLALMFFGQMLQCHSRKCTLLCFTVIFN